MGQKAQKSAGNGSHGNKQLKLDIPKGYLACQGGRLLSGMRMTLRTESSANDLAAFRKRLKR